MGIGKGGMGGLIKNPVINLSDDDRICRNFFVVMLTQFGVNR
jgi:hypothetical protein